MTPAPSNHPLKEPPGGFSQDTTVVERAQENSMSDILLWLYLFLIFLKVEISTENTHEEFRFSLPMRDVEVWKAWDRKSVV